MIEEYTQNPNVIYVEPEYGNHFGFYEGGLFELFTNKTSYTYPAKVALEFFSIILDEKSCKNQQQRVMNDGSMRGRSAEYMTVQEQPIQSRAEQDSAGYERGRVGLDGMGWILEGLVSVRVRLFCSGKIKVNVLIVQIKRLLSCFRWRLERKREEEKVFPQIIGVLTWPCSHSRMFFAQATFSTSSTQHSAVEQKAFTIVVIKHLSYTY